MHGAQRRRYFERDEDEPMNIAAGGHVGGGGLALVADALRGNVEL